MEAVTGVFQSRSDAESALSDIHNTAAIPVDRTTLLTPGSVDKVEDEIKSVPTDSTEQPGMGNAMGALIGGGVGLTGGSLLMALVPGLGPVTAIGLLGAGILGAAGAAAGASIGGSVERATYEGLPEDEIFVYEDALRRGRTVVVAMADNTAAASVVRDILKNHAAETVDRAREQWWTGLRSAEESRYAVMGKNFSHDEKFFRMGFEAALHARTRCMEFDQVSTAMNSALEDVERQYPGEQVEEPFTRGYRRGREHYQSLCDEGERKAS